MDDHMDSDAMLDENEFKLCLAAIFLYHYEKFSNAMSDYSYFLKTENNFEKYLDFLKKMTDIFLKIPTVYDKLSSYVKGKSLSAENIHLMKELCDTPYSDAEKSDRLESYRRLSLINKSSKKILKYLENLYESDVEILDYLNFLKFSESTISLWVNFNVKKIKEDLNLLLKEFGVQETFINCFHKFIHEASCGPHTSMPFNQQLDAFQKDIEVLCHELGVLPFGLIHVQQQDFDDSNHVSYDSDSLNAEDFENNNEQTLFPNESIEHYYSKMFKEVDFIDSGSYGTVMKVKYRHTKSEESDKKYYAIKLIPFSDESQAFTMKEVDKMEKLKNKTYLLKLENHWVEEFHYIEKSQIPNKYKNMQSFTPEIEVNERKTKKILLILMEYCQYTLQTFCDERDSVEFSPSLAFAHQLLEGLENIHDENLVHGDLASRNIFMRYVTGKLNVKIGDFGLMNSMKVPIESKKNFNDDLCEIPKLLFQLFYITKTSSEFVEAYDDVKKHILPATFHSDIKDERSAQIGDLILRLAAIDFKQNSITINEIRSSLPSL